MTKKNKRQKRTEGIELLEDGPDGGGKVKVKLTYPVITDADGKVPDGSYADGKPFSHDMRSEGSRRTYHLSFAGRGGLSKGPVHDDVDD